MYIKLLAYSIQVKEPKLPVKWPTYVLWHSWKATKRDASIAKPYRVEYVSDTHIRHSLFCELSHVCVSSISISPSPSNLDEKRVTNNLHHHSGLFPPKMWARMVQNSNFRSWIKARTISQPNIFPIDSTNFLITIPANYSNERMFSKSMKLRWHTIFAQTI